MKKIALAALVSLVPVLASAQSDVKLPDFGSSAGGLLSPEQEEAIGQDMLRQLRGYNLVLDDPQITEYVESLGYRLVANSERPEQEFTFFVVRSQELNAFAAPGGYIGVYTGLIGTAEAESELAAVLAHEVAHVTQRHLVRAFENIKNASLPIALAMIGALIAAQGAGSSDGAQAAIVGGTALMQQQQINFTRHNEYEADRIGIGTLQRTEYDPYAMATFFGRMGRAHRGNGDQVPEFLRTHPVTVTRVTEAKNRADAMPKRALPANDPSDFLRFRERARVLGAERPNELVPYYEKNETLPDDIRRYALGLTLVHSNRSAEGEKLLARLVEEQPGRIAYVLALAQAESVSGRRREAQARLERLWRERPDNRAVAIAYADELIATGDRKSAARAVATLRPLMPSNANDARLQLSFARACELAGDEVRAGEAHAEVALLSGRAEDALAQLEALLKRDDVDYYQRARIEARIAQITPWALEQRRKSNGVPADA